VSGKAQFGIAQADHQLQAVKGLGEWSEQGPQVELRAIFSMFPESVTLVAGADTGISSINDLAGKIVDIGALGSGTRQNAIEVLAAVGIDWQRYIQPRGTSLDDRLARYMNGEIDAFFYTVGHPNKDIKFATFSVRRARLIPLENIDGLIAEHPYFSRTLIVQNTYPMAFNNVDIETVGVNAALLTSASVPDDVVYAVTSNVFEYIETLSDYDADFSALMLDRFLEGLTAPIHPGALRFYREKGLQIAQD
jgi:TRAP transporter TAXI family solute receptor